MRFDYGPINTLGGVGSFYHHLYSAYNDNLLLYITSVADDSTFQYISLTGDASTGALSIIAGAIGNSFDNIYFFSPERYSITISTGAYLNRFSNIYSYNSQGTYRAFDISSNAMFEDIYIYDCAYAFLVDAGSTVRIHNLTADNITANLFTVGTMPGGGSYIYNPVLSNVSTLYSFSTSYDQPFEYPMISIRNYNGTTDDDRMLYQYGILYRDTTDARSGTCIRFEQESANQPNIIRLGIFNAASAATDITLSIYAKDNAGFNGTVELYAMSASKLVTTYTEKTMTTSYAEQTLVVSSDDLIEGESVALWARIYGTAGAVFFDDFSYSR